MSFVRREFYTKDKDIQRYFDILMSKSTVSLPPLIARDIGKNKTIRNIRELDRSNPFILIGNDRKFNVSIITIRDPIKIKKIGDKYVFSL